MSAGSEEVMERATGRGADSVLWRVFANVKFGVSQLIVLAVLSIIGTVIPQTTGSIETLQGYVARIGPERAALYDKLGLLDVYHTWWFNLVLVLMCTSIAVATIDRWPKIYKAFSADEPVPPPSKFKTASVRKSWDLLAATARLHDFKEIFAKFFGAPQLSHVSDKEIVLYSNRGRWTRMGVIFVHIGILTTAAGAVLGNFLGFTGGQLFLREGTASNEILLLKGVDAAGRVLTAPHTMPFAVRCDDFHVEFYEDPRTGRPTQKPSLFRSRLAVIEGGREVLQKDILVNDPLRYGGYTFYQASYDEGETRLVLEAMDLKTGAVFPLRAKPGEPFKLAGDEGQYVVRGLDKDLVLEGPGKVGAIVGLEVLDENGTARAGFPLLRDFAVFRPSGNGETNLLLKDITFDGRVQIGVADTQSGERRFIVAKFGEPFKLPGEPYEYRVRYYDDDYELRDAEKPLGPAVVLEQSGGDLAEPNRILLLERYPGFDGERKARHHLTLEPGPAPLAARLEAISPRTGERAEIVARLGEPFALPGEGVRQYVLRRVDQRFARNQDLPLGPGAEFAVLEDGKESGTFTLLQDYTRLENDLNERHLLRLKEIEQVMATGLQIAKDPGVWVVWAGCAFMVFGLCLAFFVSHKKSWLRLTPEGAAFAGFAYKHRMTYENKAAAFYEALESALPVRPREDPLAQATAAETTA